MTGRTIFEQLSTIDEELILDGAPGEKTKKNKRSIKINWKGLATCAAMLLVCVGSFFIYKKNYAVAATVSIDVNPSIEIKVNESEKVLEVTPLNEDAMAVIGNMDFKGSSIELTVNALVGSMYSKGYIDDVTNSILLTIESDKDTTLLCEKLTAEVEALIHSDGFDGSVISQMVTNNEALKALAEKYGISAGKAQLINTIVGAHPDRQFEELVPLTITELCLILGEDNFTNSNVSVNDNPSNSGYIGEEAALKKVTEHFEYMGVSPDNLKGLAVKLKVHEGTIVYEIKYRMEYYGENHFSWKAGYTHRINAVTGKLLDYNLPKTPAMLRFVEVKEGQFSHKDGVKVINAKYTLEVSSDGLYYEGIYCDLFHITEDGGMAYYYMFEKDGYNYRVKFDSITGELVELSKSKIKK